MSQEAAVLDAARLTYGRLLPYIRRFLGPTAAVFFGSVAGGILLGPVGTVPGAGAGATLSVYADQIIAFFTLVVTFIMDNPSLAASVFSVIGMIRNYMRNPNQNNQVMDHPHPQ